MLNKVFDNSMISDYRLCPRYFEFRHIENLVPKGDPDNFKASFGSAIHEALEVFYEKMKEGLDFFDPEVEESVKGEMTTAFLNYWSPFEGQDDIRTAAKGIIIVEKYYDTFKEETFKVIETEIGGAITMGDYTIILKSDTLIEENNELKILEHKTSAHRGFLITKPNSQLDTYIVGVREITGREVKSAILNQIYFRKGRSNEKQEDTVSFVREETYRNEEEIKEWCEDTYAWCEAITRSLSRGYFARNPSACTSYGGCQYRQICESSDNSLQQTLKEAMFEEKMWEPWPGARGYGTNGLNGDGAS